jgi:phage gp36-like protein
LTASPPEGHKKNFSFFSWFFVFCPYLWDMQSKTHTPTPNMSPAVAAVYQACEGHTTEQLKHLYKTTILGRHKYDAGDVAAVSAALYRLLEVRLGEDAADTFTDQVFTLARVYKIK